MKTSDIETHKNPQSWFGKDLKKTPEKWIYCLNEDEIEELNREIKFIATSDIDLLSMNVVDSNFPLLSKKMREVKNEVLHGTGIFLIRGVPVDEHDMRKNAAAFLILGKFLGLPVSQNGKGHVLGHVANLGFDYADAAVRGYQTSSRLPYHTDSSDVVGLFCIRPSKKGGLSSVVSSTTVWNELQKKHPQHAKELQTEFYRTRWGEIPENEKPYSSSPIFISQVERVYANYVRSGISKAQLIEEIPRLTKPQIEAMDALDSIASDPENFLDMELQQGDVQLLCNWSTFHSRTAYEDYEALDQRRHLLRLWLACEGGPDVPAPLIKRTGLAKNGRPNGIEVPGVKHNIPLIPE